MCWQNVTNVQMCCSFLSGEKGSFGKEGQTLEKKMFSLVAVSAMAAEISRVTEVNNRYEESE